MYFGKKYQIRHYECLKQEEAICRHLRNLSLQSREIMF